MTAIQELETAHPVSGFCAFHWKAEHLLQQYIFSLTSSQVRAGEVVMTEKGMSLKAE
jgi:hypothetical protein